MEWIIQNKDWLFSGIGVVIITGIIGFFFKRKKHKTNPKQSIKSGDKSYNIQGGKNGKVTIGDKNIGNKKGIYVGNESTNIQGEKVNVTVNQQNGLSYEHIRQVAMDIFKSNFFDLGEKATQIAKKRAEEITNKYIEELQKKSPLSIENTQSPDILYALYEVQKSYARLGNIEISELLIDLLVRRTIIKDQSFETLVLSEAVTTVPKLTLEHMNILSLIFIVRYIYLEDNPPFQFYYDTFFDKFLDMIEITDGLMFYEHLKYSGCITIDHTSEKLKDLIESFNDGPKITSFPKLVRLEKDWNVSSIAGCSLSTVGIAIAISNLKMRLGLEDLIELSDYISD